MKENRVAYLYSKRILKTLKGKGVVTAEMSKLFDDLNKKSFGIKAIDNNIDNNIDNSIDKLKAM